MPASATRISGTTFRMLGGTTRLPFYLGLLEDHSVSFRRNESGCRHFPGTQISNKEDAAPTLGVGAYCFRHMSWLVVLKTERHHNVKTILL